MRERTESREEGSAPRDRAAVGQKEALKELSAKGQGKGLI